METIESNDRENGNIETVEISSSKFATIAANGKGSDASGIVFGLVSNADIAPVRTQSGDGRSRWSCGPIPSASSLWSVVLFCVTTILLFADQNLMSPNLTAIAREFGFNDEERDKKLGGDIALAFFVLGAPASYVIGCLADTCNRSVLFAITVGIGEAACFASAFCRTYWQLFASRAITGIALGGALPLIGSLLGDLFVASQRHIVNAVVGMGTGLGIMLGQAVAGYSGPTNGWRFPFIIISAPALVCAALVLITVKDPARGQMEAAALAIRRPDMTNSPALSSAANDVSPSTDKRPDRREASSDGDVELLSEESGDVEMMETVVLQTLHESQFKDHDGQIYFRHSGDDEDEDQGGVADVEGAHNHWETFRRLLATPTVRLCLLQGAPGCVPWGIIATYLNDFLAQDKGMTVEAATSVVLVFGLGNFFGLLLGGSGGSYLYSRDKRFPALLAGTSAIVACFPFWYLINLRKDPAPVVVYLGALLVGFLCGVTGPIVKASLTNVTLPQARGQAFALFSTFDDFGKGLGPFFVSSLISLMGGQRVPAFNIGIFGWVICGIVNLLIFFTVEKDENRVQLLVGLRLTNNNGIHD